MFQYYCVVAILSLLLTLSFKVIAEDSINPAISKAYAEANEDLRKRNIQEQIKKLQKNMVTISAGSFSMGDIVGGGAIDEHPVHKVRIKEFKLGRYEVTFAQWDACNADGACSGHRPADKGWGRGDRPVINVTWDDAQNFIEWLNQKTGKRFRLPSEAEWEYAARAGTSTNYSWGNEIGDERANCKGCKKKHQLNQITLPVGSFKANGFGLYDMHGNVWEWVVDCWSGSYRGAPENGTAWLRGDCEQRVIRGGSWFSLPSVLRSANRSLNSRTRPLSNPGFRLAQD